MFDPIEIHGAEDSDYFSRIYWDEDEGLIGMEYVHKEDGSKDGEMLFTLTEAEDIGYALTRAADLVHDAQYAARLEAAAALRAAERARVAEMAAEDRSRSDALKAQPVRAEIVVYPRKGNEAAESIERMARQAAMYRQVPFGL
jgi:hypothetical protein